MRILIVEDEERLASLICDRLKKEKYTVDISLDGLDGLDNALTDIYDLIILDVMLPKVNGIEILKQVRSDKIRSKVIMLTAKSELEDKLLGFETGADDYITKPFHIDELLARVNVQLRKNSAINNTIEYKDIILDLKKCILENKNTNDSINIINKEFQLLEYFLNNPNQVLSKELIYEKIWGLDNDSLSNNLEAYLSFIRKKLKLIDSKVTIKAVRNLGYKMEYSDEEIK